MTKKALSIKADITPQANAFDDNFLNVVGNEFKFNHAKGLAEWMKNSADAYSTTTGVKDAEQFILLRFKQANPKKHSVFECVDFVGMTKDNIDTALKVWGSATAAKRGTNLPTFGGHGNGGKFYMRQMFGTSRFITFRGGLLNVFGFNSKKKYGYAKGLENVSMTLDEALAFADIDGLDVPKNVRARWKSSKKAAGFTVVRGDQPGRFSGSATISSILERLQIHPQARRLLTHKQVIVVNYGSPWGERLTMPEIMPRAGFERPREIPVPKKFSYDGLTHDLRGKFPSAKLVLKTSDQPLSRAAGELAALNSIDIMGEIGCIGSYRIHELGYLRYGPESEFIYGECECPRLEDETLDCVKNDREKLVPNDLTAALLEWIRQQVDTLSEEMAEKRRNEKKSRDLRESSLFNQLLDKWKNTFMTRMHAEIFGGSGIGGSFGGAGGGSASGGAGGNDGNGGGGRSEKGGEGEGQGGGSGDKVKKGPRFPRVLLSGEDRDPLDNHATEPFECDERHPPVYQRPEDIEHGIYWINTSKPLANKIMDQYGAKSPRWREYLFQRYVDIIFKQSIYELGKREPNLSPDKVDTLVDEVTSRVHDAAANDLETFLFEEHLTGSTAGEMSEEVGLKNADGESTTAEPMSLGQILSSKAKQIPKKKV